MSDYEAGYSEGFRNGSKWERRKVVAWLRAWHWEQGLCEEIERGAHIGGDDA